MRCRISGIGWVTPLGVDVNAVCESIAAGEVASSSEIENAIAGRKHEIRPVPTELVQHLGREPRLRRSSPISYFAVAAGLAALADAGLTKTDAVGDRTALVFGASNGSVLYTRRFYEQLFTQGANAASPMLFPETVYNAPASHLASFLGINGATYTLVGDQSVGCAALTMGAQLLALGQADRVLVVGCEELDWILCEAYHDWRLAALPLSEGAAAMLLTSDGEGPAIRAHAGVPFFRRPEAASALVRAIGEVGNDSDFDLIVSGANRSFIDGAEASALEKVGTSASRVAPKLSFGEAVGAGALWQCVTAVHAVRSGQAREVMVPVIGFNHQASAVVVSGQ